MTRGQCKVEISACFWSYVIALQLHWDDYSSRRNGMCNKLIKKGKAKGSKDDHDTTFIWFCNSSGRILRDDVYWARMHDILSTNFKFHYELVSTAKWTKYIASLNIISLCIHLSEPINSIQSVSYYESTKVTRYIKIGVDALQIFNIPVLSSLITI